MADTATVSVEVLNITLTPGRGRLVGFAQVSLTLDGIELILQGVRLLCRADGLTTAEMPCYRHADGDLVPALALPEELEDAVARTVLEAIRTATLQPRSCRPATCT